MSDVRSHVEMSRTCSISAYIDVCRESVRLQVDRFGTYFVHKIRKRRSDVMRRNPQRLWHLDKVFVTTRGDRHYLWRAVDHEGDVLESHVNFGHRKALSMRDYDASYQVSWLDCVAI